MSTPILTDPIIDKSNAGISAGSFPASSDIFLQRSVRYNRFTYMVYVAANSANGSAISGFIKVDEYLDNSATPNKTLSITPMASVPMSFNATDASIDVQIDTEGSLYIACTDTHINPTKTYIIVAKVIHDNSNNLIIDPSFTGAGATNTELWLNYQDKTTNNYKPSIALGSTIMYLTYMTDEGKIFIAKLNKTTGALIDNYGEIATSARNPKVVTHPSIDTNPIVAYSADSNFKNIYLVKVTGFNSLPLTCTSASGMSAVRVLPDYTDEVSKIDILSIPDNADSTQLHIYVCYNTSGRISAPPVIPDGTQSVVVFHKIYNTTGGTFTTDNSWVKQDNAVNYLDEDTSIQWNMYTTNIYFRRYLGRDYLYFISAANDGTNLVDALCIGIVNAMNGSGQMPPQFIAPAGTTSSSLINPTIRLDGDIASISYNYVMDVVNPDPELPNNTTGKRTLYGLLTTNYYEPPCITKGTRILTPNGYVPVEDIKQYDYITTSDGRNVIVRGVKSLNITTITPQTVPYLIPAHTFGENKPERDVKISRSHLVEVGDNLWMSPRNLAKQYAAIAPYGAEDTVTYYSILTANYFTDNLVVEGGLVIESLGERTLVWDEDANAYRREAKITFTGKNESLLNTESYVTLTA